MTLRELPVGGSAEILSVGGEGALRQHFLDMGLIPGARVKLVKYAPLGDPMELMINGYALTLRLADAGRIGVVRVTGAVETENALADDPSVHSVDPNEHPGFGEGGKYHDKTHENPLPEGTTLTFALAGNQNCGKTTLFNQLTGANQHVGNFPGVTVDRKDGVIRGQAGTLVTDLPGIYSLSPYTSEEIVSRDFILHEKPRGIINIVDAGNIERNLYLTMQLMELGVPMVLALNMMDEVRNNGGSVRVNEMEEILGLPVVPISAAKNEGIDELVEHAIHVARYQEKPARQDFCDKDDHGGAVHRCLHGIMHLIEDHAQRADLPLRFAASRLVEGDAAVEKALGLQPNEKEMVEHIIVQMERERGLDRNAAMADMRFAFIRKLAAQTVVKPRESKEYRRSRRIDRVLTGRWTAIPIFVLVMSLVIWLSIDVLGAPLQDLLDQGIQWLAGVTDAGLENWGVAPAVRSLVVDGVFGGVGTVVSFVPIIIILFFFLSMLEDSGYMARVAFVTDKLLRKIGLSGRSIVPLLIGEDPHLRLLHERLLPGTRGPGARDPVSFRHPRGHPDRAGLQVPAEGWRRRSFRDGAAELPPAGREERGTPALGQDQGLPPACLYGDFHRVDRHLGAAELRFPLPPGGSGGQHARRRGRVDRPAVPAARTGRLAHRDGAGDGFPGEGERGGHPGGAGRNRHDDGAHRHPDAGVLPAVYALRRRHRRGQARTGRQMGSGRGGVPVPGGLAGGLAGLSGCGSVFLMTP